MTRFDFSQSDDDTKGHSHFRCWRCRFFRPIGESGALNRIGVCHSPHSSHSLHVIGQNHPVCPSYTLKDGDEKFGLTPAPEPNGDDDSITLHVPKKIV